MRGEGENREGRGGEGSGEKGNGSRMKEDERGGEDKGVGKKGGEGRGEGRVEEELAGEEIGRGKIQKTMGSLSFLCHLQLQLGVRYELTGVTGPVTVGAEASKHIFGCTWCIYHHDLQHHIYNCLVSIIPHT